MCEVPRLLWWFHTCGGFTNKQVGKQGRVGATLHTCRQSEVNKKRELNMQAEVKRAEIAYVQKVLHRSKVANFIQTTASPPLCWLPGKPNAATQALLQQEQAKLDVFKVHIHDVHWPACL